MTTRCRTDAQDTERRPGLLLDSFQAIDYDSLLHEIQVYRDVFANLQEEWEKEASSYEEQIDVPYQGKPRSVPRRNYPNEEGKVEDSRLYPYHDSCYLLLDAYNVLYQTEVDCLEAKIGRLDYPGSMSPQRQMAGMPENCLPCSHVAVERTFPGDFKGETLFSEALYEGANDLENNGGKYSLSSLSETASQAPQQYPDSNQARADLMLKLLRHALSELQRDHILAGRITSFIAEWKLCDDPSTFRRFWSTILAENISCDGYCAERSAENDEHPDHSCEVFAGEYLNAIPFLTWWGVTFFTTEHANILSAMIQVVFDNSFSAAAAVEETYFRERLGLDELQSVESRQKTLLKRNLAYQMQNEEEDSDDEEEIPRNVEAIFPYRIFTRIVIGLAKRVMLDRENVLKLRLLLEPSWFVPTKDMEDPKIILERSIDSYYNALRTLLHLAELAVRRLPNNQGTMNLFGRLVHALVCAFVNPPRLDDGENFANFLGLRKTTLDPNRYAERITNATDRKRQQEEIQKNMESASDHLLQSPPPQEVVDVLQSLYRRDQVEIEVSRVGYGDVLCLLGLEISASDALLFYHSYNTVQIYDEDLEEENDDEVLDPSTIVRDEDGNRLTETQQAARYNFTLTRLLQAWHAPWSPESHQSFQVPFREAARTLFLSAHRIGMPFEIARLVVECCRRDWWEDPVRQCWHTDCQTNKATDVVQDNWLRRMARSLTFGKTCNLVLEEYGTEFISCKCQITQYCSREHQKDDYGEHNHCMQCGKPPFRIPGKEELALCRQVFGEATEDGDEYYGGEMDDDDDDDEGSWETIDSHDENADAEEQLSTTTRIVTQWFEAMKRTRATGDDDEASEESEVGFANGQD